MSCLRNWICPQIIGNYLLSRLYVNFLVYLKHNTYYIFLLQIRIYLRFKHYTWQQDEKPGHPISSGDEIVELNPKAKTPEANQVSPLTWKPRSGTMFGADSLCQKTSEPTQLWLERCPSGLSRKVTGNRGAWVLCREWDLSLSRPWILPCGADFLSPETGPPWSVTILWM